MEEVLGEVEAPLWMPWNDSQRMAFESKADQIGFGGSAGGGKSQAIIGLALTRHQKTLILRRESTQLGGILQDLQEVLYPTGASFNGTSKTWKLLDGRIVELGGVANPGDEQKYRGRPHDLLCIDESDSVPEHVIRFLSGWLRTTISGQQCQLVLTFNPPSSAEGQWILEWFAPWIDEDHPDPAAPGELRWFATLPNKEGGWSEVMRPDAEPFEHNGEIVTPKSRTFIPARVQDNPFLANSGYIAQLQSLPEPLRSQLLYGDFKAGLQDGIWQAIPTAWLKAAMARWKPTPPGPLSCLGCDISHGGADSTAIAPRHGHWFDQIKTYQGLVTDTGAKAADLILRQWSNNAAIHVDVIGIGWACCESLQAMTAVRPFVFPIDNTKASLMRDRSRRLSLGNVRTAGYWLLREALDPDHGLELAIPPDKQLLKELTAFQYEVRGGEIVLEQKKHVKQRIGVSPDKADSLVLSWLQSPKIHVGILGGTRT